jgi:hypothetical protein
MAAGCCVQIVEATGRMATKTVISASGDGISKITGTIVIVQDEQHVAALKSKAAAANFVAYTKSELATCGDLLRPRHSTSYVKRERITLMCIGSIGTNRIYNNRHGHIT